MIAIALAGCCSDDNVAEMTFGSSFNQETYVWESFMFPTNRTTGAQ